MKHIVVIGSGIAGLASSWLLARRHRVDLIERDSRVGGHTHTHDVDTADGRLRLDSGFLVHNDRTYPLLIRLFDELNVRRMDSDMSFGVTSRRPDFEYSSRSLNGWFAQRTNLIRPGHHRLLLDILRFNREAPRLLTQPGAARITLGDFLDSHKFSAEFTERFLFSHGLGCMVGRNDHIAQFPCGDPDSLLFESRHVVDH